MQLPVKTTQHQIERMARHLEQTMARRRRLLKALRDLDQDIRAQRKLLRDVIAEATAPVDSEVIAEPPANRHEPASDSTKPRPKRRRPKPRHTASPPPSR